MSIKKRPKPDKFEQNEWVWESSYEDAINSPIHGIFSVQSALRRCAHLVDASKGKYSHQYDMKVITLPLLLLMFGHSVVAQNSLPSLEPGKVAQTVEELWAGYDPRIEPLDVEMIREWDEVYEEKQIKVQMLTFTVGTLKIRQAEFPPTMPTPRV